MPLTQGLGLGLQRKSELILYWTLAQHLLLLDGDDDD